MHFELKHQQDLSNECCICQNSELYDLEQFNLMDKSMYGLFLKNSQHKNIGEALFKIYTDNKKIKVCYLEVLCTLSTGLGHGSLIMKELIEYCKKEKVNEIRLVSLDESFNFYKKLGFITKRFDPVSVLYL